MKVKLEVPVSPAWQRAFARAAQDRAAGIAPERVGCRTYRVASCRPDHLPHTVVVNSVVRFEATCDCEGAANGNVCRHMAHAWSAAVERIANAAPAPRAPEPLVAPDKMADWFRARASA